MVSPATAPVKGGVAAASTAPLLLLIANADADAKRDRRREEAARTAAAEDAARTPVALWGRWRRGSDRAALLVLTAKPEFI
jgi:hypothetical protein